MFRNFSKIILITTLIPINGYSFGNNEKNVTKLNSLQKNISKSEDKENILHKIGIVAKDDKIIIEPKKAKEFLENLAKTLQKNAKEIEKESCEINKSAIGVSAKDDKIVIDLNKTKNVLEKFSKHLQNIVKDLEKVLDK